jgi:hypothetical protein
MDGAGDRRLAGRVDAHLAGCPRCTAFVEGAGRIRELVRFEAAPPIPDLVPEIMGSLPGRSQRAGAWLGVAAAFVAGAIAGAVLVAGLPGIRTRPRAALATEVPRQVAAAASRVTRYRATFDIVERNFHPDVPLRRLVARVAFAAPERFRAQVGDRTAYPSASWPSNDLVLEVDRNGWRLRGPMTCPREALPRCAPGGTEERALSGREPFDGQAPVPTDIVLPLGTLAGSNRVRVTGHGSALGRDTVEVELAYRDAIPLFAYLHAGGAWRPLFPLDRVHLSLDAESWFPLRYGVFPAAGPERAGWALRNGLPTEAPGAPVLDVVARSLETTEAPTWDAVRIRGGRDLGFREIGFAEAARGAALPADLAGLRPYRAGRVDGATVLSYTRGLSWLKVRGTHAWPGPRPFGLAGGPAEAVSHPGGGRAFYQPATAVAGRQVSVHTADGDVVLESNLPRRLLLAVAGSLPLRGEPLPRTWLVDRFPGGRIRRGATVEDARDALPGMLLPHRLPAGYRVAQIDLVESRGRRGVTVHLWRRGTELDGMGIVLHQSSGSQLPPPMEPDVLAVRVRGTVGRYSPSRGELEWVEAGTYRSLRAEVFGLAELVGVAGSLAQEGGR